MYVYAEQVNVTSTDQEVSNDKTMAAGASTNAGIEHGTPYNDGMEGTTTPLLADNDDDNIKEVDMPGNEPTEIIDDDTDDETNGEQEDPTDQNPGDNSSQKQDGVSNTAYDTPATDEEDTTKDHVAGDNSKGSIKVEDVDDEDDGNDSDDDADNAMGVDIKYPNSIRKHKEDYIPYHGGQV